jgi:UV DNA damage endonuclease
MKLGLVCTSEVLKEKDSSNSFRRITRKKFIESRDKDQDAALSSLAEIILHNLELTIRTIEHCSKHGIDHYRISSGLFPLITDVSLNFSISDIPEYEDIILKMKQVGVTAKKYGISVSMHPDQYNVLASTNEEAVEKTANELNFAGLVLEIMGFDEGYSAPVNIHVNCSTKNCEEIELKQIADRFMENFSKLDSSIKSRLVLENEDKGCWNCENLFKWFHLYCGAEYNHAFPLTYDNLHHKCNPSFIEGEIVSDKQNVDAFYYSWDESVRPVFHWSEGTEDNPRSHADYISEDIPDFEREVVWECEVKAQDKAILKLLGKSLVTEKNKRFEELASLGNTIEMDEGLSEQEELEEAKRKIAKAQNKKLTQGYNAIYGV